MGNVVSSGSTRGGDPIATSESETMEGESVSPTQPDTDEEDVFHDISDDSAEDEARARAKEEEMVRFRKELSIKREQRKEILARHRTEKEDLEKAVASERQAKLELLETNKLLKEVLIANNIEIPDNIQTAKEEVELRNVVAQMQEEFEKLKDSNNSLRKHLAESNVALQGAYSDIADLTAQNTESIKQINALKDVISVSKTLINLREEQLNTLKTKLNEIEKSLADRESSMLSTDLRQEYERQLQNIRTLRGLYEERARLAEVNRQGLVRDLDEQKRLYQLEVNKVKDLNEQVEELETKVRTLHEIIENKNDQISTCQTESRGVQEEMTAVNKLFSQVLLGYKSTQDLDKLVHRLEENHGLLTHMAERENGSEASSALPKLLLQLVSQVDEIEKSNSDDKDIDEVDNTNIEEEKCSTSSPEAAATNTTAEEIVQNLPKVWRVLMELLSHQTVPDVPATEKVTQCYKSVETKSGPVLVPSVSQTYIRLKDLILEKLALIKEVNRMKQLNNHLETRLGEQERRLCLVTNELSKTWHVVGRLRRHHHQLHTHEKILKYELQQKRKLLNELKEELEYCREKWEQAREKNTQSEKDWRKLRAEFSSRKTKSNSPSMNNSAESGYSDERPSEESSESNDESEYVNEPLGRCKKKLKKSFETIFDSSTDHNLVAEREDPASDMLDVAELPLDAHDADAETSISESCHSRNVSKNDKLCEETEDEVGDIANDPCSQADVSVESDGGQCSLDKQSSNEHTQNKRKDEGLVETSTSGSVVIDPAAILKSIQEQNERLAKKDKKLESLEKSSAALLKKTQSTAKISEQINSTLDHLINRPTSSKHSENRTSLNETDISPVDGETGSGTTDTQHPNIDPKAILESIKKQNERLAKKDERLKNLEQGCEEVVKNITNTLNSGDSIVEKLDSLHSKVEKEQNIQNTDQDIPSTSDVVSDKIEEQENEEQSHKTDNNSQSDSSEPSTSSEMDHEARFAARDLRLKRLEEQTKSLVNKVNKTATKGVKINYKLEELHNIYGSENSRAGSPADDSDSKLDKTSKNEDDSQEE